MSMQITQINAVTDSVADRNSYWDRAASLVEKMMGSDNATEIMADFLTKLAYSPTDADPVQVLGTCCWDWDCAIDEDEEEVEYVDEFDYCE